MNTCEMVALADENGKIYQTGNMYYQKNKGFHDYDNSEWEATAFDFKNGLSYFIHLNDWSEIPPRYTHAQLIKLIGHDFEYVGE